MTTLYRQHDGSESPLLPRELCLLISDCLEAPATFLVAQHLAQALKAKRRCIMLGLSQSFDYYNAVVRKQVRPDAFSTALAVDAELSSTGHTTSERT